MNLKNFLKELKLNESNISMILGAIVIVVVGILVINYFREGKGLTLPGLSTTNQQNPTGVPKTYTVVKGDNLWKIAQKTYGSGYNWVDVAKVNNLKNPSVISAGQELTLPEVSVRQPQGAKSTTTVRQTNVEPITGATYTVVRGDSLWKIAVRAYGDGFQWVKISRENKLVHPNLIHPGNVLTLPR